MPARENVKQFSELRAHFINRGSVATLSMNNTSQIIQYFLGELPAAEAERFEEKFFADEQFAESVFAVEDELLEAYARGELPDDQRERFERNHLTTGARREALALTQGLVHLSPPVRPEVIEVRPAGGLSLFWSRLSSAARFWPAYAACLLLLILSGFWWWGLLDRGTVRQAGREGGGIAVRDPSPNPQPTVAPPVTSAERTSTAQQNVEGGSEPSRPQSLPGAGRRATTPPRRAVPAVAVFSIQPGLLRSEGGGEQVLSIPAGARTITLRAFLKEGVGSVRRAELLTADGEQVLIRSGREVVPGRGGKFIPIDVPARLLTARVYLLRFFDRAGEPVESYTFRVSKPAR